MANPTRTTTVHHLADKRFVGIHPDGVRVQIDGMEHARTGMSPMDLVLNAVGGCAAFDIVEMIEKRKLDIRAYRVELRGDRTEEIPRRYTSIHAVHVFDVPGLERKMAERFVDLATNKYCSVAASLRADITYEVVLEHDEGAGEGADED